MNLRNMFPWACPAMHVAWFDHFFLQFSIMNQSKWMLKSAYTVSLKSQYIRCWFVEMLILIVFFVSDIKSTYSKMSKNVSKNSSWWFLNRTQVFLKKNPKQRRPNQDKFAIFCHALHCCIWFWMSLWLQAQLADWVCNAWERLYYQ